MPAMAWRFNSSPAHKLFFQRPFTLEKFYFYTGSAPVVVADAAIGPNYSMARYRFIEIRGHDVAHGASGPSVPGACRYFLISHGLASLYLPDDF